MNMAPPVVFALFYDRPRADWAPVVRSLMSRMTQWCVIRVPTTYSTTGCFVDQGAQRGLAYDAFRVFETRSRHLTCSASR